MGSVLSLPENGILTYNMIPVALILYLLYHVSLAIYNLYFHPLSKYPGPRLAAATRIPLLKMLWDGNQHTTTSALHAKYGPVVRFAPNDLSFMSAPAWKDIYGHRVHGKQSFLKDPSHYGPTKPGESSIINTSDEDHTRVRRILANSFSDKALKEQEPMLQTWADMLVRKLGEKAESGTAVDMVSYYNFTTFDIMADLTFGEPLHMLEGSEYSPWVRTIFASIKIAARMRVLRSIPGFGTLIQVLFGRIAKKKQLEHESYTDERVDKRLAKENPRPDLWSHILRRKSQTEGGLSLAEMHSNASIFMIAGTETTATLLSGATYLLLRHPDKLARLQAEIRGGFPSNDDLTVAGLAGCQYLNACLNEALRCYPPVPTGLPRVVPEGGAQILGDWVPGGTIVSVDHWSAYRSPANFHRPNDFVPERWLSDEVAAGEWSEFANDDKAAFNPFSFGPRTCLGKNLAYHEARLLLAKVLWNYDLELADKEAQWNDQGVFFLWDKPALMVRLTPAKR